MAGAELAAMRASGKIEWGRLIPVKQNIETVLEIKFTGDKLQRPQRKAYERIAGADRFRLIELSDCDCDKERSSLATEPVRVPVVTPMEREAEQRRHWYQLPPPRPLSALPPRPQRPQYEPIAEEGERRSLTTFLKENPGTSSVILVGAIVLVVAAAKVAIVAAVVLAFAAPASAARKSKEKDPK